MESCPKYNNKSPNLVTLIMVQLVRRLSKQYHKQILALSSSSVVEGNEGLYFSAQVEDVLMNNWDRVLLFATNVINLPLAKSMLGFAVT